MSAVMDDCYRGSLKVADLRAQVHDAGVFLLPLDGLEYIAVEVQEQLAFPVDFGDLGVMTIPSDMSIGRRWNKLPKKNGTELHKRRLEGVETWTAVALESLMDLDLIWACALLLRRGNALKLAQCIQLAVNEKDAKTLARNGAGEQFPEWKIEDCIAQCVFETRR